MGLATAIDLDGIGKEMKAAQDEGRQIAPWTSKHAGFDNEAAYEAARRIHGLRQAQGWVPVGRKIGFTNASIWPEYGVHEPVWGYVYEHTRAFAKGGRPRLDIKPLLEPRIEPEIMFCMRSAPPAGAGLAEILACVEWVAHGFEIVQTQFPGWKFRAPDTVIGNGLHGRLLVGEPREPARLGGDLLGRLATFTVTLSCNGVVREQGRGSNVLGSPLAALRHLLTVLARQPHSRPVSAGEIVTTGTLTAAYPIKPGETWQTKLEGIDLPGMTVEFE